MPTQPGPPAGAQQIPEPPEPFTLHLKGQDDSWLVQRRVNPAGV
jgi:hypothetical protein